MSSAGGGGSADASTKKAKSGGFQSMGLSANILGGIMKMCYKVPTPIQRKALPLALSGRDVVAMARTGTACCPYRLNVKSMHKVCGRPHAVRGLYCQPVPRVSIGSPSSAKLSTTPRSHVP